MPYRSIITAILILALPVVSLIADDPGGPPSLFEVERSIADDARWLDEADAIMRELTALDVRMHVLINRVGSGESRRELIQKRSEIRRLIYELVGERNVVVERLDENRELWMDLKSALPSDGRRLPELEAWSPTETGIES